MGLEIHNWVQVRIVSSVVRAVLVISGQWPRGPWEEIEKLESGKEMEHCIHLSGRFGNSVSQVCRAGMSGKVGGVEARDRLVLLVPELVRSELLRSVPGLYSESEELRFSAGRLSFSG